MPHVLLDNTLYGDQTLRDHLRSWGLTCGLWDGRDPGAVLPGIWECDTLLVGPETARDLPWPARGENAGPLAPILGWDGDRAFAPRKAPGRTRVPVSGGGGLLASLQVCVAHAGGLRDFKGSVPVLESNPLRVIGHELLTPLTAVRTALEILDEQLGEDGRPDPEGWERAGRMVRLALRNATRLGEALDWSRGLVDGEAQARQTNAADGSWRAGLGEKLARLAPLVTSVDPAELPADPEGVADLAGRMVRSLREALPGYPVQLHVCHDRNGRDIVLWATPVPGSTPPLDQRAPTDDIPTWDPWRQVLQEATGRNIPSHLPRKLDGVLEIRYRDGVPGLALRFAASVQDDGPGSPGLALRDSATVP